MHPVLERTLLRVRSFPSRLVSGHSWLLWWLVAGFFAVGLLPLNVALAAEQFDVPPLVALVAGIGQSTALVLILVRPRAATALHFAAIAVLAMSLTPDSGSTWPLTVPGVITLIVHVVLVAARYPRPWALVVWWTSVLLLVVVVLVDPRGRSISDGLGVLLLYPIFSAMALGAVLLTRQWREIRRELADARHDVEVEQSQRAVAEERTRIARELHDVVAHSLSVVIAQADGGRYAGTSDPQAATGALEAIAATGRQALTDMRSLLGVLREDGGQEFAPQPDVAAIDRLVADVQASGLDVDLIVEGAPVAMPAGPQLAAYRIVQESLTNVLKHAGPASRAWVRLHWRPDALEVAVLDDGRGAAAAVAEEDGPVPSAPGHGLLGMRERAELHGGRLTAAPRHGGGFGVQAVLPYRSPR
jgi:signal transduction histidine kinase